jgi:hypothetical protein
MFFTISGHSPLSPDGRTGGLKQNASFEGNRMPIKDIRKILDCKFGNLSRKSGLHRTRLNYVFCGLASVVWTVTRSRLVWIGKNKDRFLGNRRFISPMATKLRKVCRPKGSSVATERLVLGGEFRGGKGDSLSLRFPLAFQRCNFGQAASMTFAPHKAGG